MSNDFSWFQIFPPKDLNVQAVTAALRPLAGRPRQGLTRVTPLVVFECWVSAGTMRWLMGMERSLVHSLPHQMTAQLPGLSVTPCSTTSRPVPTTAMGLRQHGLLYPLRTDMAGPVAMAVMQVAERLQPGEHAVLQWVVGPSMSRQGPPPMPLSLGETLGFSPPREPDSRERRAWQLKVQEPLYAVRGRIGATSDSSPRAKQLVAALFDAVVLANSTHGRLSGTPCSPASARRLHDVIGLRQRWSAVLNASDLATCLAFPVDGLYVPGSIGPSLAPAPTELLQPTPSHKKPGNAYVLGASLHPADGGQMVTLPSSAITHNLAITGPTGSGKSNLAASLIIDAADAGQSIVVIEPKGDLIEDVMARLPKHRYDDVVIIEPTEHGSVIGLDPLAGPRDQAERRADELLDLFKVEFGSAIGPRSADCLLHSMITAARLPDGTLPDVPILLSNASFRRQALAKVNDPLVLGPFWSWFDSLSEAERGQVVAPIMNKLRVFTSRPALRRMVGQAQPKFQMDELLTKRRIVLVNANRGLLGPAAKLLGSLLLTTQLWPAIQRRAAVPAAKRHPVMVVVDEWPAFVGALDFGDALATCRGYGAGFVLINQNLDQLSPAIRAATLANCRSRVTFRPAQGDARALAAVLGGGVTADDLERLGAFQAAARVLVGNAPSQPFAIRTQPLPNPTNDIDQLRHLSAQRYGRDGQAVDDELSQRWQGGSANGGGSIGVSRRGASS